MKIVIINGSARKGNTLTAINAFIKGASEKNEIEIIEPDKLNIAPCKGCDVCQCSKGCVDMEIFLAVRSSYAGADRHPETEGADTAALLETDLHGSERSFEVVKQEHIAEYQEL